MAEQESEIIYHYTSQKGLLGILETKAIWATDLFYLNDASEFNHAIRIAQDQLDDLTRSIQGEDSQHVDTCFVERLRELLNALSQHHIYVSSFSEEGNSLSQWKLYGANYRGFSIGFNLSELEACAKTEGFHVQKCLYDEQKQAQMIRDYLEVIRMAFHIDLSNQNESSPNVQAIADQRAKDVCVWLMIAATHLKNSSFEAEREWRLIRHYDRANQSRVEFRDSGFSLVPFEKINLPQKGKGISISKIFIGPALDKELARRSLEMLLSKYEIDLATNAIESSNIPLRDSS